MGSWEGGGKVGRRWEGGKEVGRWGGGGKEVGSAFKLLCYTCAS